MMKLNRITLYTFCLAILLFCKGAQANILSDILGNLFGVRYVKVNMDLTPYNVNPGISENDLAVYEEEILPTWEKFTISKTSMEQNLDLNVLLGLNLEAAQVWRELVSCYGSDAYSVQTIKAAKEAYFARKIDCGGGTENILQRIQILHTNIKNWIISSARKEGVLRSAKQITNLPPVHPLLGQVIVEAFAYYKAINTALLSQGMPSLFPAGMLSVMNAETDCRVSPDGFKKRFGLTCEQALPYLYGFVGAKALLEIGGNSCTTYGFWPHASLYMFAIKVLGVGEARIIHPAEKFKHQQGQRPPQVVDYQPVINGYKPGGSQYYYIFWDQPPGQRLMLGAYTTKEKHLFEAEMRKHFEENFGDQSQLNFPSCWQGSDEIVQRITRPEHYEVFNIQNNAHHNFIASFYVHYSRLEAPDFIRSRAKEFFGPSRSQNRGKGNANHYDFNNENLN